MTQTRLTLYALTIFGALLFTLLLIGLGAA